MKYLGIHKIVWAILVVAWTMIEALFVLVEVIALTVWKLKISRFNDRWSYHHSANFSYENRWGGYPYQDDNIIETILRRNEFTFN